MSRRRVSPEQNYDLLQDLHQIGLIRASRLIEQSYGGFDAVSEALTPRVLSHAIAVAVLEMDSRLIDHFRHNEVRRRYEEEAKARIVGGVMHNAVALFDNRASSALDVLIATEALEKVTTSPLGRAIYDAVSENGWLNKCDLAHETGQSRKVVAAWQRSAAKKAKE
jgi:hypothetical protein